MKKNYIKPSLLSETFIANNIMSEELTTDKYLSAATTLYVGDRTFTGITFNAGNTLNSIKLSDFRN